MIKYFVSFIDLCDSIKGCKQPKRIRFREKVYQWDEYINKGGYYDIDGNSLIYNFTLKELCNERIEVRVEILDEEERDYLRRIVRPFKNRVKCIVKVSNNLKKTENIMIVFKGSSALMFFPEFKAGKMYKGMEPNKEYTLEELGI